MRRGPAGILLFAALAVLDGCAVSARPAPDAPAPSGVTVSGVVIENGLSYGVTDVMIEVPASGAFAGCGNLLPRTSCSNRFQGLDYRGNAMVIRWKERGEPRQTPEFVVTEGKSLTPGEYVVRVVIFAPGQAGAELAPAPAAGLTPR